MQIHTPTLHLVDKNFDGAPVSQNMSVVNASNPFPVQIIETNLQVQNSKFFPLHLGLDTILLWHHWEWDWDSLEHFLVILYHSLVKMGHCPCCQIHIQNHYHQESD